MKVVISFDELKTEGGSICKSEAARKVGEILLKEDFSFNMNHDKREIEVFCGYGDRAAIMLKQIGLR